MADRELTVTNLSFDVVNAGEGLARKMTAAVRFTADGVTWRVTLPDMPHDEIRHLLAQFQREVSGDRVAARLAESENFTVELIGG